VVVLATTIPLSIAASGLTLWFLLRLRAEVDRRAAAEGEVRAALDDLGKALGSERLLRRELDHRVRNNLSALLALVGMYEETDATPAEMIVSLRNRVIALRESYSLISAAHSDGVELRDLLHAVFAAVLGPHPSPQVEISIDGPSVRLSSREANAFAMIAQELLTNAAKHGVLRDALPGSELSSLPRSSINVTWDSNTGNGNARIAFHWRESPISGRLHPPQREENAADEIGAATSGGLGMTLVEGFAAGDLRGSVLYGKSGNTWAVDLIANVKIPPAAPSLTLQEASA
jgi:two-component sensor histidine kinase